MTDAPDTAQSTKLGDLLGPDTTAAMTQSVADAAAKTESLAHCGPLLHGAVAQAVQSTLDLDVLAFLADAWSTASQIHDLKSVDPANPGAVAIVKLGKHSITRELKPVIHVRLGAETHVPLDIAVALIGSFQGIELSVGGGKILGVGSGSCDLSVDFRLAGQSLGTPRALKSWKLPGEHRFNPPVAIL